MRISKFFPLFLLLAGVGLPLAAAEPAVLVEEPFAPEEAAATMSLPEGFRITLSASEPEVRQPVACCVDDRGRLWVAEGYSYPDHSNEAKEDRILIFEDKDGDGRFDERTVFYDRLNYVTGLEVGHGVGGKAEFQGGEPIQVFSQVDSRPLLEGPDPLEEEGPGSSGGIEHA